jgi:Icc protein
MAETVAFLQLSDSHVLADESELLGFNPASNVRRVVEKIGTLPVVPQFCLITGDLAQDGGVASYEHLRRLLEPIAARGVPFLPAVGNHDDRAALRQGFLGEEGENADCLNYSRTFGGLRVIVLDSLIPGEDEGRLGETQLAWLSRQLEEPAPLGTILALHHSPAVTGLASVGRLQLRDAEALREVIAGRPLLGILAGHCHTASSAHFAGTVASTAPAVVFQLAPGASEMVFAEGSGFNLCIVRDGVLVVSPVMV